MDPIAPNACWSGSQRDLKSLRPEHCSEAVYPGPSSSEWGWSETEHLKKL